MRSVVSCVTVDKKKEEENCSVDWRNSKSISLDRREKKKAEYQYLISRILANE
jgi:hypothetical protein